MKNLYTTPIYALLMVLIASCSTTKPELPADFTVSGLSNVNDEYVTLTINMDNDGNAIVSKEARPSQEGDVAKMHSLGFEVQYEELENGIRIEYPENTDDRKMFVFDIDLENAPSTDLGGERSGSWVMIYARSVSYSK